MASTASNVQAQAAVDAWLNSQAVKDMKSSIEDTYNARVAQANLANEQQLNTLNDALTSYNNTYQNNARQAYVNKMQGDRSITNYLAQLGLSNSGLGATHYIQNQGAYSQTLGNLQNALAENTRAIDLEKANQALKLESELQGIAADKSSAMYDYNQMLANQAEQIRQQEIANAMQQQYYNYVYGSSKKGSGGSNSGGSSGGIDLSGDSKSGYSKTGLTAQGPDGKTYDVYLDGNGQYYYLNNGKYIPFTEDTGNSTNNVTSTSSGVTGQSAKNSKALTAALLTTLFPPLGLGFTTAWLADALKNKKK